MLMDTNGNTKELIKDLCSRLPYGVKVDIPDLFVSTKNNIEVLKEIFCGDDSEFRCNDSGILIKHVKPYLFPLSSMTEEQKKEQEAHLTCIKHDMSFSICRYMEWCYKNHLDVNSLIQKGLAIDATGLNVY